MHDENPLSSVCWGVLFVILGLVLIITCVTLDKVDKDIDKLIERIPLTSGFEATHMRIQESNGVVTFVFYKKDKESNQYLKVSIPGKSLELKEN